MTDRAKYLERRAELHSYGRKNDFPKLCTIWTKDGKVHRMRVVEAHACLCELGQWQALGDETAPLSNGARIMQDAKASRGFGRMLELHKALEGSRGK